VRFSHRHFWRHWRDACMERVVMTIIYLVTRHKISNRFLWQSFIAYEKSFQIASVFDTLKEAKTLAKNKDSKSERFVYKVKKIVLKEKKHD
jgi:hypothetical protein